jgi:hypothetical protein
MCFNPSPERRVPSPNRYMAFAKFCFCKNNKRTIDHDDQTDTWYRAVEIPATYEDLAHLQRSMHRDTDDSNYVFVAAAEMQQCADTGFVTAAEMQMCVNEFFV